MQELLHTVTDPKSLRKDKVTAQQETSMASSMTQATTTRHAGLDRAQIIRTALEIVDEHGVDALSMRKLAGELGVTTNTIYWHVGSREELLLEVVRMQAADQSQHHVSGSTPYDRVVSAALNIWHNARSHRNVTALAHSIGATTLLELPLEQTLLAEFNAGGISGDQARDGLRALLLCTAGFLIGAWHNESNRPRELRNATLWSEVTDERIDQATLASMRTSPNIDELFEATVRALVADLMMPTAPRKVRR